MNPNPTPNPPADPLRPLLALLENHQSCRHSRPLPASLFHQLHALFLTSSLSLHSVPFSLLLRLSALSSLSLPYHLLLLRASPRRPTAFLCNTLLAAFCSNLDIHSALSVYSFLLPPSGPRPNAFTYPPLLRALPGRPAFALAAHSVKYLGERAAAADPFLGAALVDVFARCGMIGSCRRAFDRIVEPDLPAWNALLSAYARRAREAGCLDSAGEVLGGFGRLMVSPVRPNEITLVAVIGACGEIGALGHGMWAHAYMMKHRLTVNRFVATALVEMYAKCGRLDLAEQVFNASVEKDTRCYNAMLHGLASHGLGRRTLALFDKMCSEGVWVDGVTVLAVMCACAHAGLVDEGRRCFDRMEAEFGIAPRIEHYGCLVDILGRAGLVEEAEKVVHGMNVVPNAAMYRSLIRACGIHGKLELGEGMIGELMRLEPEHGGNYVLLSNFYASMNRWEDAKRVRKEMKAMGIDKSPGSSLLDMDGIVHEFLTGDKTHPAAKEIYAMVEEIENKLRKCGHRPSTVAVLFDVEEEDRAGTLLCHSERLAIAFALLASTPGAAIRIIKNLRVCCDCHASAKLVSRIYGREIIMRDRTRFHHIKDGECSCRDFW